MTWPPHMTWSSPSPFVPCAPHHILPNKCDAHWPKYSSANPTTTPAPGKFVSLNVAEHHCLLQTTAPWDQHLMRRIQPLGQPPHHPSFSKTPSALNWTSETSLAHERDYKLEAHDEVSRPLPHLQYQKVAALSPNPKKYHCQSASESSIQTRFVAPVAGRDSNTYCTVYACICQIKKHQKMQTNTSQVTEGCESGCRQASTQNLENE